MSSRVVIVNSKVSNLRNIAKAAAKCGAAPLVSDRPEDLAAADKVILPGVGAFSAGIAALREKGLDEALRRHAAAGKPLLGICLGMQLLLDKSHEFGEHAGLGIVPGETRRLPDGRSRADASGRAWPAKVPHVGWDAAAVRRDAPALGLKAGETPSFYFTHSYAVYPADPADVVAETDSGYGPFCSIVRRGSVVACQFHLELSGERGLSVLKSFLEAA